MPESYEECALFKSSSGFSMGVSSQIVPEMRFYKCPPLCKGLCYEEEQSNQVG